MCERKFRIKPDTDEYIEEIRERKGYKTKGDVLDYLAVSEKKKEGSVLHKLRSDPLFARSIAKKDELYKEFERELYVRLGEQLLREKELENEKRERENSAGRVADEIFSEKVREMSPEQFMHLVGEMRGKEMYMRRKAEIDAILEREPRYARIMIGIYKEEVSGSKEKKEVHLIP